MNVTKSINSLKNAMNLAGIEQENGLGTELFHFASTLMPVVNVDLFITDKENRVLLSWRDDEYTDSGWHVPGSCLRFRETFEQGIQRCAKSEIGTEVTHGLEPIRVYEFIHNGYRKQIADQRERAHFVTLVYACFLPESFSLKKQRYPEGKPGHLQWFQDMPETTLPVHSCYRKDWKLLMDRIEITRMEGQPYGKVEQ